MRRKKIKPKMVREGKPRLVIASDSYLPRWDGIAKFLYDILPLLRKEFEVTVIAPKFEGKKRPIKGIHEILMPVSHFTFGDYNFPIFNKKLAKKAIREADLVWTHSIGPIGRSVIKIAKRKKKRIVSYIHSVEWELFSRASGQSMFYYPLDVISRFYIRKLYSNCDLLMMPSHSTMNLFNWYKIRARKVLLGLGIDSNKYAPAKSKEEAKKKVKLDPNQIVIGYCGRIAHEKDLKTLVRAYLRIRDVYQNLNLVLVGEGLSELTNKFSKIRGVTLTGSKDNVVPYYQAMDIYVLPSLTETTSLSTLEAMSCEIPVLATPVGEVASYVKNGKNGYRFSKGNSFELSHFLKRLIEDSKLRNKLGKNSRKTVIDNYSWKEASKKIIGVLKEYAK